MAQKKNKNDGFKNLLKISKDELIYANTPAFYLNRPQLCAIYKTTKTGELTDDFHPRYFKSPTSYPLDLNKGFQQYIFREKPTQFQLLNKVIRFLLEGDNNILQQSNSMPKTEAASGGSGIVKTELPSKRKLVLSQRGVLARLMLIPYRLIGSKHNDSKFYAIRYRGILHLIDPHQFETSSRTATHFGKFEQICYSDDPDLDPITDVPVNENVAHYAVYRSGIKEFDLLYSAEFSGVSTDHKIDDVHNLDEINQCKFIQTKLLWTPKGGDFLQHPKCLLWWIQLYLANTNDICIGFKDQDGVVRSPVKMVRVQDIPKNQKWKPSICIRFLHTMLTLVDETMSKVDCPYTVYEFKYDSYGGCIKSKIHRGKTDLSFLSEDYIKYCKEQTSNK